MEKDIKKEAKKMWCPSGLPGVAVGLPSTPVRRRPSDWTTERAGAEFAVFSPRVAEKGNSNVLAHFSSI